MIQVNRNSYRQEPIWRKSVAWPKQDFLYKQSFATFNEGEATIVEETKSISKECSTDKVGSGI